MKKFLENRKKKKSEKREEKVQLAKSERALLDEIFYDTYKHRGRVYRVNFFRGLFFGFGSLLGGTIVVAIVVWLLSHFVDFPGWLGDIVRFVVNVIQNK